MLKNWPRFANFPENFDDDNNTKMISKKLVLMDMGISYLTYQFNIYIFRALTDLRSLLVIEAKLSKVGPGLQNRRIAFIYKDLVLHA